jgi:predicted amidohydrolase YtcJ
VRTLYRARTIHTQSYPATGEWMLVDARHVQRVGTGEAPEADRVIDLPGATIIPGFIDTHAHLTATGIALANRDVETADGARALLAIARARAAREEGPIFLQGYDETRWADPRLPGLTELGTAVDRPLVIRRADGHTALANAAAIDAAGLEANEGIERDDQGAPTGRLTREANDTAGRWILESLSDHQLQDLQLQAAALAASHGITAVHEMAMPHWHGDRELDVFLRHRARLPVDATPVVATMDLPFAIGLNLTAVGGDLPVDGSIGARTAAVTVPYVDGDGTGTSYTTDDELAEFFHGGHVAGLQVGVHAIGDRAIDQVLAAWERVYGTLDSRERRHFRARRHRIEHFEMASPAHVERAAMLGLAASVQPAFDALWGQPSGLYEQGLGAERAMAMNPFRTMLERGVEVGVGSDSPVTPLDPMTTLRALQDHHDPSQRLDRASAIRLHTVGSARIGHQEEKKATLAPGMHADFAAYDADPFLAGSADDLRPVLTVSLGREVFAG